MSSANLALFERCGDSFRVPPFWTTKGSGRSLMPREKLPAFFNANGNYQAEAMTGRPRESAFNSEREVDNVAEGNPLLAHETQHSFQGISQMGLSQMRSIHL